MPSQRPFHCPLTDPWQNGIARRGASFQRNGRCSGGRLRTTLYRKRRGRGGRGGRDGGSGGGRRGRDEERTLGEEGASTAIPDGTPPLDGGTDAVEVVEVDVVELDNGEEIVIVEAAEEAGEE